MFSGSYSVPSSYLSWPMQNTDVNCYELLLEVRRRSRFCLKDEYHVQSGT